MPTPTTLLCVTITNFVIRKILTPMNTWATQLQKNCGRHKWWDPRTWFCWFISILVKVVVWVLTTIVMPIFQVVCSVHVGFLWMFYDLVAGIIDAICSRCNLLQWGTIWIKPHRLPDITLLDHSPSPTVPGSDDYYFECTCGSGSNPQVVVTAVNEEDAAYQAKAACINAC
jgi:hypothetical protein